MAAALILAGFAIAVVGVIVKVGVEVARDLREDREAHGGRQTREAARRAAYIAVFVALLVLVVIVWPLILGDD
jgi:hypothetical protein